MFSEHKVDELEKFALHHSFKKGARLLKIDLCTSLAQWGIFAGLTAFPDTCKYTDRKWWHFMDIFLWVYLARNSLLFCFLGFFGAHIWLLLSNEQPFVQANHASVWGFLPVSQRYCMYVIRAYHLTMVCYHRMVGMGRDLWRSFSYTWDDSEMCCTP